MSVIAVAAGVLASACAATPLEPGPVEEAAEPYVFAPEAEPDSELPPVLGLELGLPERPGFVVADLPVVAEDGTWSIRGLRANLDRMLPEAQQGRVVMVTAYVQEVYVPPVCRESQLCPPGKQAHAWLVDAPGIRGKAQALMLTNTSFPIPEWDDDTQREWADAPVPEFELGKRYVFMGWFRRFSDSGFAHEHGLLEFFAVGEAPLGPDPVWVAPPNSSHHPRVRERKGLAPIPELASPPPDVHPGDLYRSGLVLVEPSDREHALELAKAAYQAAAPMFVDYYHRWLIVDDPAQPRGWVELANGYLDFGEPEAAEAVFELALERMPDDSQLHNGRGRFYLNSKQPAKAIASYLRALELQPDALDVMFGLGMAYAELAQREEAIEVLERFVVLAKTHHETPPHIIRAAQDTIMRMQSDF